MEHHLATLILDLALILGTGALVTLIFRMIKQPVVLGYIIAGFLIGPHLNLFPTVADETNIKTLSELGVIFLLFGLGLEFSFKKLMRVGGSASVTALVEIVFIVIAGYLTGQALGWSKMDCIFLGGMLASSSTTIIIRAFDELGVKNRSYAKIVFGVLVVEDLVVILLMVLLSTIAVTQHIEGSELLFTIGKLLFFLILWIVLGIYLIPTFLKKIKNKMDDEGYLILSLGLCLMMVVLAVSVGFSAELGAFIMGSILAETTCAEKIEHVTKPVKDLFGAIFFVSIGMMIDPKAMVEYGWIILLITILVVAGKVISTTAGAVLSGQSLRQSIHVGMSMAQIGEFAFIVATLGMSLGVISDFLFPIAVGVSAITTFTTPYLIKYSDNFYFFLERVLPERTLKAIDNYTTSTKTIQAESEWKRFVKSYWVSTLGNAVVLLGIVLAGTQFLQPFLLKMLEPLAANMITLGIVLLVSSPFLWALMFKLPKNAEYKDLWISSEYKNGPLLIMGIVRVFIGLALIGYFTHKLFLTWTSALVVMAIVIVLLIIASRHLLKVYTRIEKRFMSNYNSREIAEAAASSNVLKKEFSHAKQSSWDIDLIDLEIKQDSSCSGHSIISLDWREKYGINIVYIKRGEHLLYAPAPDEILFPYDRIGIIASEEQLEQFLPALDEKVDFETTYSNVDDIVIKKYLVEEDSFLNGKEIKDSGIREKSDALVVGIERDTEHFLNPSSNTVFEINDIVWIVGERHKLNELFS